MLVSLAGLGEAHDRRRRLEYRGWRRATRNQSEFGAKAGDRVRVWIQRKAGKWEETALPCPHGEGLAAGDLDADGIYLNRGTGWEKRALDSSGSHGLQAIDFDGDGDVDLFGANWSGPDQAVELWENRGLAGGQSRGARESAGSSPGP